ncbi:MAG TPA: M48 family metallopeptidase [Friedmanniella sp.]
MSDATGPTGARPVVEVRRSRRRRRTVTAYREGQTVVVLVPASMSRADEQRHVDALVARLLAREARDQAPAGDDALVARALDLGRRHLAPALGTAPVPSRVTWVGNQRRRWGSCTPAEGTIRLSDRLRPMPAWVRDYVLLHELVHLVEANPTPRFHALVATYPDAERAQGYLEGYAAAARLEIDTDLDTDLDAGLDTDSGRAPAGEHDGAGDR